MQGVSGAILCKRSENSDQTLHRPCRTGVQMMCPGHQRFGDRTTRHGIWQTPPLFWPGRCPVVRQSSELRVAWAVPSDLVGSGLGALVWSGPIHSVGQGSGQNRHVGNHDIGPGIIKPVGRIGFLTSIMAATDKADTFHSGSNRRGDTGNGIFDDDGR